MEAGPCYAEAPHLPVDRRAMHTQQHRGTHGVILSALQRLQQICLTRITRIGFDTDLPGRFEKWPQVSGGNC